MKERGGRIITALIENASSGPSTQASADTWINAYKCQNDISIDPKKTIFPPTGGTIGLPYNIMIDPRTMQIVKIMQGDGAVVDAEFNKLITKNGG